MIIAHKQPIGKEITCSAIASQNRAFFRSSLSAVSLADWRSKPLPRKIRTIELGGLPFADYSLDYAEMNLS
ncbi:MAG: hypothetical protein ACLGGO_06595 [Coleofasciculus sp.]